MLLGWLLLLVAVLFVSVSYGYERGRLAAERQQLEDLDSLKNGFNACVTQLSERKR